MEKFEKAVQATETDFGIGEERFSFRDLMKTAREKMNAESADIHLLDPELTAVDEGVAVPDDRIIYELTDIVEEPPPKVITVNDFNAEVMKKVSEIAERIARDMFPEIAERVIKEEIQKLKTEE